MTFPQYFSVRKRKVKTFHYGSPYGCPGFVDVKSEAQRNVVIWPKIFQARAHWWFWASQCQIHLSISPAVLALMREAREGPGFAVCTLQFCCYFWVRSLWIKFHPGEFDKGKIHEKCKKYSSAQFWVSVSSGGNQGELKCQINGKS